MELFVDGVAFIGSWLLVAGPIFQASLELSDQDEELAHVREVRKSLPPPKRVSVWWWLLPPVKIYLSHKVNDDYRQRYANALTERDLEVFLDFRSRALGWVMVASGGFFLAVKETYEVLEHFEFPVYVFWIAIIVMIYVSISYTVISTRRRTEFNARHKTSDAK